MKRFHLVAMLLCRRNKSSLRINQGEGITLMQINRKLIQTLTVMLIGTVFYGPWVMGQPANQETASRIAPRSSVTTPTTDFRQVVDIVTEMEGNLKTMILNERVERQKQYAELLARIESLGQSRKTQAGGSFPHESPVVVQPVTNQHNVETVQEASTEGAHQVPEEEAKNLWNRSTFTGNLGADISWLSRHGIDIGVKYKGDHISNAFGGLRRGSQYLDNIDYTLGVDAEKLFGWKGTSFFFSLLSNHGGAPSSLVGDAQIVSNIEAPTTTKLYHAWIQQSLWDNSLSVRVGLYDLNSEFYVTETAGLFLNSSSGIGIEVAQTGQNGPSIFPTTSLGLRIKAEPVSEFYLQTVVLDGVPGEPDDYRGTHLRLCKEDGALAAAELGYRAGTEENPTRFFGKYALGAWFYTAKFDDLLDVDENGDPVKRIDNMGIYVLAEQEVFRESSVPGQGLALFARFGIANGNINQFDFYLGYGFAYTGLIPGRDEDQIGFAVAHAYNGKKHKQLMEMQGTPADDAETNLEFTYRGQVTPWLGVQPNLQYVINPGTDPALNNAIVFGVRFEISL